MTAHDVELGGGDLVTLLPMELEGLNRMITNTDLTQSEPLAIDKIVNKSPKQKSKTNKQNPVV